MKRAGTRSDGRKQGRNGADGCGEDRALDPGRLSVPVAVWMNRPVAKSIAVCGCPLSSFAVKEAVS